MALASVLVIAAVVGVIGIATALSAVSESQSALAAKKGHEARDFVEGCVEDALLRLNEDNSIPSTITLPEGSCSVTINAQSGDDWTFTATGTLETHASSIQVNATRTTTITITRWQEQ